MGLRTNRERGVHGMFFQVQRRVLRASIQRFLDSTRQLSVRLAVIHLIPALVPGSGVMFLCGERTEALEPRLCVAARTKDIAVNRDRRHRSGCARASVIRGAKLYRAETIIL